MQLEHLSEKNSNIVITIDLALLTAKDNFKYWKKISEKIGESKECWWKVSFNFIHLTKIDKKYKEWPEQLKTNMFNQIEWIKDLFESEEVLNLIQNNDIDIVDRKEIEKKIHKEISSNDKLLFLINPKRWKLFNWNLDEIPDEKLKEVLYIIWVKEIKKCLKEETSNSIEEKRKSELKNIPVSWNIARNQILHEWEINIKNLEKNFTEILNKIIEVWFKKISITAIDWNKSAEDSQLNKDYTRENLEKEMDEKHFYIKQLGEIIKSNFKEEDISLNVWAYFNELENNIFHLVYDVLKDVNINEEYINKQIEIIKEKNVASWGNVSKAITQMPVTDPKGFAQYIAKMVKWLKDEDIKFVPWISMHTNKHMLYAILRTFFAQIASYKSSDEEKLNKIKESNSMSSILKNYLSTKSEEWKDSNRKNLNRLWKSASWKAQVDLFLRFIKTLEPKQLSWIDDFFIKTLNKISNLSHFWKFEQNKFIEEFYKELSNLVIEWSLTLEEYKAINTFHVNSNWSSAEKTAIFSKLIIDNFEKWLEKIKNHNQTEEN